MNVYEISQLTFYDKIIPIRCLNYPELVGKICYIKDLLYAKKLKVICPYISNRIYNLYIDTCIIINISNEEYFNIDHLIPKKMVRSNTI